MLMSISKAFKKPLIGFRYPLREGTIAFSLFTFSFVAAFQFYKYMGGLPQVPQAITADLQPAMLAGLQRQAILALALIIVFLAALLLRKQPLRSMGWRGDTLGATLRMGLAIVIVVVFLRGKAMSIIDGLSATEGMALLYWAVIALCEQTVFNGYIQPRMSAWIGDTWGWLATAAMFTLWYLPGHMYYLELPALLVGVALTLGQGLVLGFIMQKSNQAAAPVLYRLISGWLQFIA